MKKLLDSPADIAIAKSPSIGQLNQAEREVLKSIAWAGSGGVSIKALASRYNISRESLTRITGFSLRGLVNWSEGAKPSASTTRRLTEVKRLFAALEKLICPEAIGPWLKEPNPAFDGSTPLQVIERGETDRVWRMVHELESGEPA
jgi:hypothetical protein